MSANDPQIGPQKIPGPKMFTSPVIKECSQLKYLDNGFKHFFFFFFFFIAQQSSPLNALHANFITLTIQ